MSDWQGISLKFGSLTFGNHAKFYLIRAQAGYILADARFFSG
ncbi:hypothetical protein Z946_3540 [Sulfitobacter noctilucicola]|nr:hypothetical protein Z946_3540 [Sulfitobacter noctilucicola]